MSDATPKLLHAALLFVSCFIIQACTPDEGRGGYAQIDGVVMVRDWNASFSVIQDTFPAMDERIYLIYGDEGCQEPMFVPLSPGVIDSINSIQVTTQSIPTPNENRRQTIPHRQRP